MFLNLQGLPLAGVAYQWTDTNNRQKLSNYGVGLGSNHLVQI